VSRKEGWALTTGDGVVARLRWRPGFLRSRIEAEVDDEPMLPLVLLGCYLVLIRQAAAEAAATA
jgi:hypothetical protein